MKGGEVKDCCADLSSRCRCWDSTVCISMAFFLSLVIIFCNVPCSRLPSGLYILLRAPVFWSRLLALRGHVTNASFKQWVGILLMPKIDRAHKNYLTPEIWEEMHLRGIFYSTLISQQSSMICIGCHVGGHTLALQHVGQNYFLLLSC